MLVTLFFMEVGAFTIYLIIKKRIFPKSDYQSDIWHIRNNDNMTGSGGKQISDTEMRFGNVIEVIHPYLGFVLDPKRNYNVSDFGFWDDVNPMIFRTNDKLIIGIFGGSFALQTYWYGRDSLIDVLRATGKEIIVVNLANGGYKQPQQLLALAYLLSLGAEFDIVINIDGFNEVALPSSENIPKNVFPIYPRAWYIRIAGVRDQKTLAQVARSAALDQKRNDWARLFTETKLYHSITSCLLWKAVDRLLESKQRAIILTLKSVHRGVNAYVVTGPQVSFANDEALYDYLAIVWKRCSIQMRAICEGNGISYYHFLQPNQYVKGSKPMRKEEEEIAIDNEHIYRPGVVKGYPLLRRYGNDLIRLGVKFHDLTMTFAEIEDILYNDDCCHLNAAGYEIIGNAIGGVIKEDLSHR